MKYSKSEIARFYGLPEKSINKHARTYNRKVVMLYNDLLDTVNVLLPINPVNGHADDFISRFFASISEDERSLIGNFLIRKGQVNSPKDISDEDLFTMLPSRYMQEPAEIDRYRNALYSYVNEIRNDMKVTSASTPSVDVSSPSADSAADASVSAADSAADASASAASVS